jgi:hypothetical protein
MGHVKHGEKIRREIRYVKLLNSLKIVNDHQSHSNLKHMFTKTKIMVK